MHGSGGGGRGDAKSSRSEINEVLSIAFSTSSEDTLYESEQEFAASSLVRPNHLLEILELIMLEEKAGNDGLFEKLFEKSKQLYQRKLVLKDNYRTFFFYRE